MKDYSSEKRRRISSAQKHYQYQVQYCKALFKHQEKEANDMYDEHAKVIQADMVSRINQKIFIQTGVREGHGEADSRVSARKLRSTTKVQDAGDTARKSKYGNGEEAPIDFYLPPDEITLDLKHIASDWLNRSKTYMGTQERFSTVEPKKVRLENGFLFVGDNDRFSASNRVEIYSTYTKEKFFGVITSMNTSELFLRLVDGSKAKVFLKHLRNHRVKISHSEK